MSVAMPALSQRVIRAPRGPERTCKGWVQEAALRMLMNNLDPEVAEDPDRLVVYGGSGKAARTWEAFLGVEVDPARIERRLQTGYLDLMSRDLDEALTWVLEAKRRRQPLSVGLVGNAAAVMPELVRRGVVADVVTDQTSAHDTLNGYVPVKRAPGEDLARLRRDEPAEYVRRALESIGLHVRALRQLQERGAVAFEYGNNIR